MNFTWLAPGWLFLLLALPLVPLVRARVTVPFHALLRAVVLLLVIAALARPAYFGKDERHRAVFIVDVSPSAEIESDVSGSGIEAKVLAACDRLRKDSRDAIASLVVVGGGARAAALGEGARSHFDSVAVLAVQATRSSGLAAALEAAARCIPEGAPGSITLLTDGLATDRHHGDVLVGLEARGIPVHVVPLPATRHAPVIASISTQEALRVGAEGEIVVDVVGQGELVQVGLTVDGVEIGVEGARIADDRGVARFRYEPKTPGFGRVRARIVASEGVNGRQDPPPPPLDSLLAVQPPMRMLYLGDRIDGAKEKLGELVGGGIVFDAWRPSDNVAFPDLARYDGVVLDDMPAKILGSEAQRAITNAVTERGLGLFASGGEAAFGPGGYHDSEIAKILPVSAQQKEEKRDPSTTLVLVVDTSGSMTGERIQLAKEVARLAMSRLLPHDKVGIVEFYGAKRWAAPIQPASNTIDLSRAINRMDAGGGTVILPAIEEAFYAMQNVQTRYKHVLVLTDGGVENGAFEPLLRRMADEGITTSTVLIGPEANSEFLVDLANWGKGRFYSVPDRFNLPEILFKQPTSSRLPAYKPGSFAVTAHGGPGFFGAVDRSAIPNIAGYADTAARPGAEVLLEAESEHAPLLATWQFGLGRVTAFMTEPVGPGTAPWRDFPGYGALLRRILERTAGDGGLPFDFMLQRDGAVVEVVATRRIRAEIEPAAQRVDERGTALAELTFEERADGRFVADALVPSDEDIRLVGGARKSGGGIDGDAGLVYRALHAHADERDELAVARSEGLDLPHLARATQGDLVAFDRLGGFAPRPSSGGGERLVELAPSFLVLGLLLYLFELFHRRRSSGGAA